MKKILCFSLGFLLVAKSNANTYTVNVLDNQFSPANLNVKVGDVIHYDFSSGGYHNATSEGSDIPAGAPAIYSGAPSTAVRTYDYTVMEPGIYNYYCEVHGANLMGAKFTASNPLPVTLKDFSVVSSQDKKPVIRWTTATEQNVNYFSVRSSIDGKQFTETGKINAKGNSSSEQHYSFTDNNIPDKYRYLYYELVIIDRDGQVSYSPIKTYKTGFASNRLIMQMGPNPISKPGQLMMQFNAEKYGKLDINVFDASGRKTLHTSLAAMPGLNNGHIHVCDFQPGVYTLQFAFEGLVESKQLVVK